MKHSMAGLLTAAGLALVACSAPSSTPQSIAVPATQSAPTAAAPAAAAPTVVPPTAVAPVAGAPTADPRTAGAPTAVPTTATAASAATSSAQAVHLVLDASQSQASYRAREELLGRNLPSDAIGTSKNVSGTIVLSASGEPMTDQSQITVDLTALQSDERRRDTFIKSDTLQTNRFPKATFVARDIEGLPTPLPTSGDATFQLSGDLTVHGVTRPVTWQVTASFTNSGVNGSASTRVNISDFGMTPPKAGPVLSIEDELTLELAFAANREA